MREVADWDVAVAGQQGAVLRQQALVRAIEQSAALVNRPPARLGLSLLNRM